MAKQANSKRERRPKPASTPDATAAPVPAAVPQLAEPPPHGRPSALLDTRVIYCGDCLEQLRRLPEQCVDLIYIDPPFNSNRNNEVFWGETKEKRAFEDRYARAQGRDCRYDAENRCRP